MVHQQLMVHPTQSTRLSNPPHTISQPLTIFKHAHRDHPEQQMTRRSPYLVHQQQMGHLTQSIRP